MQKLCWITVLCERIHALTLTQEVNCSKCEKSSETTVPRVQWRQLKSRVLKCQNDWKVVARWRAARKARQKYILGGVGECWNQRESLEGSLSSVPLPRVRAVPVCALFKKRRPYTTRSCLTCCRITTSSFNLFPCLNDIQKGTSHKSESINPNIMVSNFLQPSVNLVLGKKLPN